MHARIAVIMPAYDAEDTIAVAVKSVLAQSFEDWALAIIADDGRDYRPVLEAAGLADPRIHLMSTGTVRAGSTIARNVGLDGLDTPYAAALDADDRYHPGKLSRVIEALGTCPIATTAIAVIDTQGRRRRDVGAGPDRVLTAGRHKWVNFSMDSMLAWDRRVNEARYEPGLPNMNDLDFLMRLYATSPVSAHIGVVLHDYVKQPVSLSNGPGVTERMVKVKTMMLARLADGFYPLADPAGREGLSRFLEISLGAEQSYEAAIAAQPGLMFEDHLEPLLNAASTSPA